MIFRWRFLLGLLVSLLENYEFNLSYEFNTVLEVEDMGFMAGKSSAKPSLKLHLL